LRIVHAVSLRNRPGGALLRQGQVRQRGNGSRTAVRTRRAVRLIMRVDCERSSYFIGFNKM
jgi:hypothetical protein